MAGPRLVDGAGGAELSFGPMISPLAELRQKVLVRLTAAASAGRALGRARDARASSSWTGSAAPACSSAARDAEAVGLLDERYFLYAEDVDFCAAIRARGRRILFTPAADDHASARPVARDARRRR